MPAPAACPPLIDWGVSWRALPGERECGDLHIVSPFATGVLIAVVDGLGHGPEAAAAARIAGSVLQAHAGEQVAPLVTRCHQALRKTRGAVLSLASISIVDSLMSWTAVGNVEGSLFYTSRGVPPSREIAPARSGVVGYQLPALRVTAYPVSVGDTLVFVTDGIKDGFGYETLRGRSPQEAAGEILKKFGKDTDDALVLVARWMGVPP
jgi:negative regulator of sigma-B (phosphoserine phosphatase)